MTTMTTMVVLRMSPRMERTTEMRRVRWMLMKKRSGNPVRNRQRRRGQLGQALVTLQRCVVFRWLHPSMILMLSVIRPRAVRKNRQHPQARLKKMRTSKSPRSSWLYALGFSHCFVCTCFPIPRADLYANVIEHILFIAFILLCVLCVFLL